jgi:hypothetical protein
VSDIPTGIPEHVLAWIRAKVEERGPVPMTDRIFRHAREYHECALRCLELRGAGESFLFQPALVLLAFAIEIYLKGLLVNQGKPDLARGHDLDKLYRGLEDATKDKVSVRYGERHRSQKLTDDIKSFAKLFVELRYSYEIDDERTHDISGVAQLAAALYEAWAELRPDLIRDDLAHGRITAASQGTPILINKQR